MDSYSEELESKEWRQKRLKILKRDGFKCSFCGQGVRKGHPLQVHHTYYIFTNKAWQYPDDALITLCENCHDAIHTEETITVYTDSTMKKEMKFTPCKRCDGKGFLKEYLHVRNGICFRCKGMRYEELIDWDEKEDYSIQTEDSDSEYDMAEAFLGKYKNPMSFEEYVAKYNLDFEHAYVEDFRNVLVIPVKGSKSSKLLELNATLAIYMGYVLEDKEDALGLDIVEYDEDDESEFDGVLTDIYKVASFYGIE